MQCSTCATVSLRGFLKALIDVELQATRLVLPPKQFAVSRRRTHNSPNTRILVSPPNSEDRGIPEPANPTESNDIYLPSNSMMLRPKRPQENKTDTRPRAAHPDVLQATARAINHSNHATKEHNLRLRSEVSTGAEPHIAAWEGRSLASQVQWWQSPTTRLTPTGLEVDTATLDSSSTKSMLNSANGFVQEEPRAVEHEAKWSGQPLVDFAEVHSKSRDPNKDLGSETLPVSKNIEFASKTGWPRSPADSQLQTRNEHRHQREPWQTQKNALKAKFGSSGWSPRKRLSPDALEGIRALHAQYPDRYTTPILAHQFQISPEAVRRILKSKWRANEEEEEERRQRWDKRGAAIWSKMVEIGIKPPKKWRDMGIGRGRNHLRGGRRDGSRASAWKSGIEPAAGQESGTDTTLSDRIL